VAKSVTLCPAADPGFAQKEWQTLDYGSGITLKWGITDYSIKAGYGSNHAGYTLTSSDYQNPIPGPDTPGGGWPGGGNYMTYRGYLTFRFYHRDDGFFLNYRRDQSNGPWRVYYTSAKPQNLKSIMFMDRQRSPAFNRHDGGIYELTRSNHNVPYKREASGCNIIQLDGSGRWMDLEKVWSKGAGTGPVEYINNYYDITGYGESEYYQYVDDKIASEWGG
jgi:hypothetical protein